MTMSSHNPVACSPAGRCRSFWRAWLPPRRSEPLGPPPPVFDGLPTPERLRSMEAQEPGSGARLLDETLSKRERALDEWIDAQPHRRRQEMTDLKSAERRAWARMLAGYAAALVLLIAGTALIVTGHSVAGMPVALGGVATNMVLMVHYLRPAQHLPRRTETPVAQRQAPPPGCVRYGPPG